MTTLTSTTTKSPTTGEFARSLMLTTPHEKSQRVADAQWLLIGHNRFANTPHPIAPLTGAIDKEWGPVSAGAAKEAKRLLGYPTTEIDTRFGQKLYRFLVDTELPPDYQARRAAIIKALSEKPLKQEWLAKAITYLGVHEDPYGSNDQEFGLWYGENGVAWCAIFVSYCISHIIGRDWKYAYVPTIHHDAALGLNGMSITKNPQPGDLATYNFEGPDCHVEFFEHTLSANTFSAVGGNTGPSNYSNGGEVYRSTRYYSNVTTFISLNLEKAA